MVGNHLMMKLSRTNLQVLHIAVEQLIKRHVEMW